uniref:MARVEL domain-containing protein n=1 Tax=Plectus sambesii TaxID=2011161 RepID=A0A914XHJ7_9BILA
MATTASFPGSHTTTVTATTTRTTREYEIRGRLLEFDPDYVRSRSGILKIVQIVLSLVALIISAASYGNSGERGWACFVSFIGVALTLALLVAFVLTLNKSLNRAPWLLIEMIYYIVMTLFFLLAGILMAVLAGHWAGWNPSWQVVPAIAAALLFLCMILFGVDAVFKFRDWRSARGNSPQLQVRDAGRA